MLYKIIIILLLGVLYCDSPKSEPMRVGNYNEVYLSDDGTQYTTPYSGSHGYGQWFGNALSPKNKN